MNDKVLLIMVYIVSISVVILLSAFLFDMEQPAHIHIYGHLQEIGSLDTGIDKVNTTELNVAKNLRFLVRVVQ